MTDETDSTQHHLCEIRQELNKLSLTQEQRDSFAERLAGNDAFVRLISGRTVSGELRASPFSFAGKVQAVVDRFQDADFTAGDYLKAVNRRPDILNVGPDAIARNINGVVDLFDADGLTAKDYLKAAVKQPSLFIQSPETLTDNITGFVSRFAADGLTDRQYLRAALHHPSLFTLSPSTAEHNIRSVVKQFENEGMTSVGYLRAALQTPVLFSMSPETISRHIRTVIDLSDRQLFRLSGSRGREHVERPENHIHRAVIDFLLVSPRLLTLADDNFGLREIHSRLTAKGSTDSSFLTRPRHAVEREVIATLGHNDHNRPVETDGFVAGTAPFTEEQAKRFVLRALLHAGFIKGGSMER